MNYCITCLSSNKCTCVNNVVDIACEQCGTWSENLDINEYNQVLCPDCILSSDSDDSNFSDDSTDSEELGIDNFCDWCMDLVKDIIYVDRSTNRSICMYCADLEKVNSLLKECGEKVVMRCKVVSDIFNITMFPHSLQNIEQCEKVINDIICGHRSFYENRFIAFSGTYVPTENGYLTESVIKMFPLVRNFYLYLPEIDPDQSQYTEKINAFYRKYLGLRNIKLFRIT